MAKITAKEIAAQLGISAAAVSMAINGKPGVSDKTRAQVLAACTKLGYQAKPSAAGATAPSAKTLGKKAPTKTICFIIFISEMLHIWENSTVYTFHMQGVETAAKSLGYNTLIRYLHAGNILDPSNLAFLQSVDGLILLGTDITPSCADDMRTMLDFIPNTPTVILDSTILFDRADCIGNDNFGGAQQAVTHLTAHGCKKIAYFCARPRIAIFEEREAGARAALNEANLPLFAQVPVGISNEEAYSDILAWLHAGNPLPDGIFAENDVIAAAAARAMAACDIKIPAQVSIIGFDNIPVAEQTNPPLSTIHCYKTDLGASAVHMIVHRQWMKEMMPERTHGFVKVQLATRLVERQSVNYDGLI